MWRGVGLGGEVIQSLNECLVMAAMVCECRRGWQIGDWAWGERREAVDEGDTESWGMKGWKKGGRDQSFAWQLTPGFVFLKYSLLQTHGSPSSLHPQISNGSHLKVWCESWLVTGTWRAWRSHIVFRLYSFFTLIKVSIWLMSPFKHLLRIRSVKSPTF